MAKIQVILLEDVAGQGRKGEIVTVSDGYARNFLFNNKKGVLATPEELQKIENNILNSDVIAIGPGIGKNEKSLTILEKLLNYEKNTEQFSFHNLIHP